MLDRNRTHSHEALGTLSGQGPRAPKQSSIIDIKDLPGKISQARCLRQGVLGLIKLYIYEAVPKTVYPIAPRKKIHKKMYSEHPRLLYSLRLAAGRSIFLSKRIVSKSPSKPSSGPLGGRFIRGWGLLVHYTKTSPLHIIGGSNIMGIWLEIFRRRRGPPSIVFPHTWCGPLHFA